MPSYENSGSHSFHTGAAALGALLGLTLLLGWMM